MDPFRAIHFRPDGMEREALDIDTDELERRIAICYTGEPRLSGINNWEIFKRHIDGDPELFELFEGIRDSARNVREALLANDWGRVSETMQKRYPNQTSIGSQQSQLLRWTYWLRRLWQMAQRQRKFAAPAAAAASHFSALREDVRS